MSVAVSVVRSYVEKSVNRPVAFVDEPPQAKDAPVAGFREQAE